MRMQNQFGDAVILTASNGIKYLQFKRLLEYPEIQHCYTLRHGNIDFRTNEMGGNLQQSYDKICTEVGFYRNGIIKPHQTHTDRIEVVQDTKEVFNEVDGLITDKDGITLCTTSADCTSLLFYDPIQKVIADVHSGWRGTLQKIGQKAVKKMIEVYKCNAQDIICCICPHIRKCHFEVGEDVAKLFYDTFSYMNEIDGLIVKKIDKIIDNSIKTDKVKNKSEEIDDTKNEKELELQKQEKYYVDTTQININLLKEVGLKDENIIDSGICTVCDSKNFHSYRVDREVSGRNGAMIMKRG